MSKRLLRSVLNNWWKGNKLEHIVVFEDVYREVTEYLQKVVEHYKEIGYKKARFKKYSPK